MVWFCHDVWGFVMTRGVVQVRVCHDKLLRWRAAAEERGVSLSELVRGAVEAKLGAGSADGVEGACGESAARALVLAAYGMSGQEVGLVAGAAPGFVPAAVEPEVAAPVVRVEPSARAPVDVGALLKRGQEDRGRAGKRESRGKVKAGVMCEHRLSADQFCEQCDGEAS